MTEKRFNCHVKFSKMPNGFMVLDYIKKGKKQTVIEDISREKAHSVMDRLNELSDENEQLKKENKNLKAQLYCDEDGVCNQCEYHYLVKDEDSELGYYKSRCRKGHTECARISLSHCNDFEIKNNVEEKQMSERRFVYYPFSQAIKDRKTKCIYEGNENTSDFLNQLYDKIVELKIENQEIKKDINKKKNYEIVRVPVNVNMKIKDYDIFWKEKIFYLLNWENFKD